jgi:hypothetical protein
LVIRQIIDPKDSELDVHAEVSSALYDLMADEDTLAAVEEQFFLSIVKRLPKTLIAPDDVRRPLHALLFLFARGALRYIDTSHAISSALLKASEGVDAVQKCLSLPDDLT